MKYQKRNRPYENVKENVLVLTNDGKSIITLNNTAFAIWQNCECKLRSNGMPVPLLRNCYSIFNGTKYR